jgi:hypothetical protein
MSAGEACVIYMTMESCTPNAVISIRGVQYAIIPRKPVGFTGQYSLGHIDTPIWPVSGLEELCMQGETSARHCVPNVARAVLSWRTASSKDVEAGNARRGPGPRCHINTLAARCGSIAGGGEPGCPGSLHPECRPMVVTSIPGVHKIGDTSFMTSAHWLLTIDDVRCMMPGMKRAQENSEVTRSRHSVRNLPHITGAHEWGFSECQRPKQH